MATPLKDVFFQRPFFERLAAEIRRVHPAFDSARFLELLYDGDWEGRALKARMRHAAEALGQTMPTDYRKALRILLQVEAAFDGFDHLLFADFVERFGVADPEASLPALEVLTRTTAEFAIRPFIERDPERTLDRMLAWTGHRSERVRRLASEGCRPRLPWGRALPALQKDPGAILPILEALRDDPSEDVRRSVANNLGDIAKDHPELAVDLAQRWLAESASREPLLKHGLRSLLKKGHRRALSLFGFGAAPRVEVVAFSVTPRRIPRGGSATLRLELRSTARVAQQLRLEYEVAYARPSGRPSVKVFQIASVDLAAGERLVLSRRLSFVDRTIRRHHPGPHAATLVVNGHRLAESRFSLT